MDRIWAQVVKALGTSGRSPPGVPMKSPRLQPLNDFPLPQEILSGVFTSEPASLRAFRVERSGEFGDRYWLEGDVVVCGEVAREGERTVLCARRYGRPMLGRVTEDGLEGSVGEPCHPCRWQPSGRVLGAWRRQGYRWKRVLREHVESETPVIAHQLSLFAA